MIDWSKVPRQSRANAQARSAELGFSPRSRLPVSALFEQPGRPAPPSKDFMEWFAARGRMEGERLSYNTWPTP